MLLATTTAATADTYEVNRQQDKRADAQEDRQATPYDDWLEIFQSGREFG
jgi:hypothetical protein